MFPGDAVQNAVMNKTYDHLLVAVDGPIATVTLNRVERRNALSLAVMRELTQVLQALARTDVRGVILAVARNVGRKRALEMAMTGDPIDAGTAAEWGLINRAVPPEELESATRDLIDRATRGSALSKALGKQAFYRQIDLPQNLAYDFAVERMATATLLPDSQEGIAAFLEKRPARFTQRPDPEDDVL